jgi:RNA polymerase sigma-70 factor (ECF subfamily)
MKKLLQHPQMPNSAEPAAEGPADSALLIAIADQDREAFQHFYDRYAGRLLAYVQAMGRGRLPVDDHLQEIFVAVWRKAGQYRPELGTPEAWLFTITRNKVFDIWRARPPVGERVAPDLETLMDTTENPDPALVATIHQALARLPEDQRRPLVLAYFGGFTYEEAARRLAVPVGTLKSRIRAALGQLRAQLEHP